MKRSLLCLCLLLIPRFCTGQTIAGDQKFSRQQLKTDLLYLKQQIYNVHVNPYSELTKEQYELLFNNIELKLNDSATATYFLKLVKPVVAHLSDEHAQVYLRQTLLSNEFSQQLIYLPVTLKKQGDNYSIADLLTADTGLKAGDGITEINGQPIARWVALCAQDTTGFPQQRLDIALRQFGYFFPWANAKAATNFIVKTSSGKSVHIKGTTLKVWTDYLAAHPQGKSEDCEDRLSYKRYGNTGYIDACWFDVKSTGKYSLDSIKRKIDRIFKQIDQDGVGRLVIDVSRNGGGNTAVGEYLISSFYDKPYNDYQLDHKKSAEYQKLYESWGFHNKAYADAANGTVLHYPSATVSPENVPVRFKGTVIVVMGKPTFSSAMTFVTLIKDNHMAKLVGQPSLNGHPSGLGEQYYTYLPNTKIFVRLSVKEFIRPAGKSADNILHPDAILTDEQLSGPVEMIKATNR